MKGDRILINDLHRKKAELIYNKINRNQDKLIICIGGSSGTGKSEQAHVLRDLCHENNKRVQIISLDNYYKIWENRNELRKKENFQNIGIQEIDWGLINNICKDFLKNKIVATIQYNIYTKDLESIRWNGENIDILIIEGLYANYIDHGNIKFHLEGDINQTEEFRLVRNKEILNGDRQEVLKKEQKAINDLKKDTDYLITFNGHIEEVRRTKDKLK